VTATSYAEINRRLAPAELAEARRIAREVGLTRLDARRPHPRLRVRVLVR
jgi:putative pyruvate formate lyase activating enzyme